MSQEMLGDLLARGRTAEVYAWGDRQILKLYLSEFPSHWVDFEAKIARIVQDAGLPTPRVGEIVQVNGRRGLVYERVEAGTMLDAIRARPMRAAQLGRALAELHAVTHNQPVPDLPSQREELKYSISAAQSLPDDLKQLALRALEALPDGAQLCHGDLHPGNVLMTARGPLIIDWMTAKRGNPVADVARTYLLLSMGNPPSMFERIVVNLIRSRFVAAYLEQYSKLRPLDQREMRAWFPVLAAARLNENIAEERTRVLKFVEQGLRNK